MAPLSLTQAQLAEILSSSASPLQKLIELEGDFQEHLLDAHIASDAEILTTYFSSYVIALLHDDDIHEARMLLHRTPKKVLELKPVMEALPRLVQAVWTKDHTSVYQILKTTPWHKETELLIQSYLAHYRDKVISDTTLSYESIRLPTIESKLGLELDSDAMRDTADEVPPQLIKDLSAKGWTYDAESKLAFPAPSTLRVDGQIKLGQMTELIGHH